MTLTRWPLASLGRAAGVLVVMVAGVLAGTGWLYVLRGLGWLAVGPRISDALPLLQLAGFDGQPLLRVLVAWVLAGALTGVALVGLRPWRRAALCGLLGLILLILGSQASYALARNLRFGHVLFSRAPGLGPLIEAAAFAAGSALPRPLRDRHGVGSGRSILGRLSGLHDRRLRDG